MRIHLIFPHQLFENVQTFEPDMHFVFVEEPLFFTQYPFHKQKLILHRTSMQLFETELKKAGYATSYLTHQESLETFLHDIKPTHISVYEVVDDWLHKKLFTLEQKLGVTITYIQTPLFLCSTQEIQEYFSKHTFFQGSFYTYQRKKFDILIDPDGTPTGGKWSHDEDNRKRLPKEIDLPTYQNIHTENVAMHLARVTKEIESEFPQNYGSTDVFVHALTHTEAHIQLEQFLEERMAHFGDYEDAIKSTEPFLFHSCISSALNIGLLTPEYVLRRVHAYCTEHAMPLNSHEGFIRQIIGWREYIRAVYILKGRKQRTSNHFRHSRHLTSHWWNGTTDVLPVDDTIKKVLTYGYCHHIERLMILGNFMLLSHIHPDSVYEWFMTLFIDAYDWVMVPNVYGMSQYADGGIMTTKPYLSSSNYIIRMSDYSKGNWHKTWDALYWHFIQKHRDIFLRNPRSSMMVHMYDKMSTSQKNTVQEIAQNYFKIYEKETR